MPRVQLVVEVPRSEYQQLEELATREEVTVHGLLVWTFKGDIVERARQGLLLRAAPHPDAA